jgi:hypothetical protein
MVPQVPTREVVHDQIDIFTVLKSIVHVDYEWILKLSQYLSLIHDRLETPLGEDPGLGHFLHSILLFALFALYLPHFPEASLPDTVLIVKGTLRQGYTQI